MLLPIASTTGRWLPWMDIPENWTTPYKAEMSNPGQAVGEHFRYHVKAGSLALSATINKSALNSYSAPLL